MYEIIERIDQSSENGITYAIDLLVLDSNRLCPTWLSLPAPVKYVRTVQMDFRVLLRTNVECYGGDSLLGVVSSLLRLVGRFIVIGPSFFGALPKDLRGFTTAGAGGSPC